MKKTILMPLPNQGYDPTEVAIAWKILRDKNINVIFATPNGKPAQADPLMLSGEGLDPWGWIPYLKKLKLIGLVLRANRDARSAHQVLIKDKLFQNPLSYLQINPTLFHGLYLPGGHAKGMKLYLECNVLQSVVANFFDSTDDYGRNKPVAAICHGVLLAARATSRKTNRSVLFGKKTTALTWDLEKSAWLITRFFARFWEPNYYRTYIEQQGQPEGYMSVESEVKRALQYEEDFKGVQKKTQNYLTKTLGIARDNLKKDKPAWVVCDGNYVSARWPGDVHTLTKKFVELLTQS